MKTAQGKSVDSSAQVHPTTTGDVIKVVPLVLKLKNLIVPIDFSETSEKALQYAGPLAKQFKAKITLLHVMDSPMYPEEGEYLLVDEYEVFDRAKKRLAELALRAIAPDFLAEIIVRRGVPFDTIVAVAHERHADLIVTTTHGYTGLKHVAIGSTAERIVRHAPCPVLVVRDREHRSFS